MIDLLQFIHQQTGAYQDQAPQDATFPYAVFTYSIPDDLEVREDVVIDINIWDRSPDTTAIETLADSIQSGLSRKRFKQAGFATRGFKMSRQKIADPDPEIRRIELRIELKTFFIGE